MKNEQFTITKTALVLLSFIFLLAFSFCSKDSDNDKDAIPAAGDNSNDITYESLTVTDREGNVYEAVQIGDQIWMAENLNVQDHYYGISMCPGVLTSNVLIQAYCAMYGNLYSYAAILDGDPPHYRVQGLCPDGWSIPREDDWAELEMYLGMPEQDVYGAGLDRGTNEGRMLKSESLWDDSGNGSNDYGFNVLPSGFSVGTNPAIVGRNARFWTYPPLSSAAYTRFFDKESDNIGRSQNQLGHLLSLRCVKNPE